MKPTAETGDSLAGFGFGLSACLMWGLLPLYMKLMAHMSPVEIVAHRILWSIPVAGLVLVVLGRMGDIVAAFKSPRILAMGALTASLISINWGLYVWSITSGNALEAALGFFINPLFSVFLGYALLKERLSHLQWAAVALAFVAVVILTIDAGRLPLAALGMTLAWGLYSYFKKSLPIGPNQGFLLETLILAIPSLGVWIYLARLGESHASTDFWLLAGSGIMTAIPLMCFANGAKRLRLSTIAILQYVTPTMIFLLAVFVFDEPFGSARLVAFPMIWLGLIMYSFSMFRQRHG